MKASAITRIILFSLAIFLLTGILLAGLGIGLFTANMAAPFTGNEATPIPMAEADDQTVSVLKVSEIRNLEIEWAAGDITIMPSENIGRIVVSEPAVQDKHKMLCQQNGDTLKIQFSKSHPIKAIGINYDISKDLTITVPKDWVCGELDIEAASASVKVKDLTLEQVDFDGASGICTFENCNVTDMDLDTVSGNILFTGSLDALSCDAVSANCEIIATNVPREIDMEGVSGDLRLTLPKECGFTINADAVSGNITSDFPTQTKDGKIIYGDGYCRISMDGISGDISIRQK